MSENKAVPTESLTFFDGVSCPVCQVRLLRRERFHQDISTTDGFDAFVLEYCGGQLVMGFVLQENMRGSFLDAPDWALYSSTNFICPVCEKKPKRQQLRSLGGTMRSGLLQAELNCPCGLKLHILVMLRRWGFDVLPDVLPEEDRPPVKAEAKGPIEDDLFQVLAASDNEVLTEIGYLDNSYGDRAIWKEPIRSKGELARELNRAGLLERVISVAEKRRGSSQSA